MQASSKAKPKREKNDVDYGKGMPQSHCSICTHYRDGSCELVKGAIGPGMWCKLFKK